jgi:ferredoxin
MNPLLVLLLALLQAYNVLSFAVVAAQPRTAQVARSNGSLSSFRPPSSPPTLCCRATDEAANDAAADQEDEEPSDPRLYTALLSRATGIEWGTDLSFRWVYVRSLEPDGSAAMSGLVSKGDQVCSALLAHCDLHMLAIYELFPNTCTRSITFALWPTQLVSFNGEACLGAPFDYVMTLFSTAPGQQVELSFFKGTTQELRDFTGDDSASKPLTVTVLQTGKADITLDCLPGTNLRDLLVRNGINVYQSITRWTNCKGKQLCGTCIVDVVDGGGSGCTIKSIDERSTLRDNPPSYRLSCVTNLYKDVTVKVFPPIGADQWTR